MSLSLVGSKCAGRVKIKYEMMNHDSRTYIIHYRNTHILVCIYNVMCIKTKRIKSGTKLIIWYNWLQPSFWCKIWLTITLTIVGGRIHCEGKNRGESRRESFSTKMMLIVWMIREGKSSLTFHSTPHVASK